MSRLAALRRDRLLQAVLGLAALAVGARLVGLGARVAHQDEARVGYWTLRFLASGQYEYRPIVHGPFIHVVDRHLFALFGPSDFVARLPMAVLGGLFPAAALLFRSRLRDAEVFALAALFAANPVLLYYSRFMRQDVPLAVLATVALGFAVRAVDTAGRRRRRYVYLAGLAFGLAATTKENVLLYPVAWAGALALVLDQRLIAADDAIATVRELVPDAPRPAVALPGGVRRGAVLLFVATTPVVAAVADLGGNTLGLLVLVSGVAYFGAVHGGTVWHLLGGLPLFGVGVTALVRPAFNPRLTTFVAGVLWVLAALLLADERLFRYDPRVVTDGGSAADADDTGDADDAEDADEVSTDDDPADGVDAGDADEVSTDDDPADGADAGDAARPATGTEAGTDPDPGGRRVGPLRARLLPLPPLGVAYVLAFLVVILFYAPRGGGYPAIGPDIGGWGLWSALAAGSLDGLSTVVRQATYGAWTDFLGRWAGDAQDHAYLPFFLDYLNTMRAGALTLSLAAVGGLVYDRYTGDGREFVAFCAYWGVASVFGYPLVTDIAAPWATVHAIVPLAVPAAVGLAADGGRPGPDLVTVAAVAVVLLGAGVVVGGQAYGGVYQNPQSADNELVQYAQSSSADLKPVIADVRAVAGENDGVDVLWYGDEFDSPNESEHDQPPAGPGWFERLPLVYYTEMESVTADEVVVNSTTDPADVRDSDAPVVVAFADDPEASVTDPHTDVEAFLTGYGRYRGQRFLYDTGVRSSMVYFVDADALDAPAGTYETVPPSDDAGRLDPAQPVAVVGPRGCCH